MVAIAWTLANSSVATAIVGVRTLGHLEGVDRAAELKLDEDAMKLLDSIFNIINGTPIRPGAAPEAYSN